MKRILLVLVLALAPAAHALVPAPVIVGVATQGSVDEHATGQVCAEVLTPFVLELRIVAGAPTDVLRLTADAVGADDPSALATLATPAVIQYVSPDSCARFSVEGLRVEHAAAYEATALALPPL
ncbi:MAG TPA: hypothetical protein VM582_07170 [Candidatus Thermoplasmatota archaeon]|nr:hypothetical protein [Candidatus Thermoplasmatota archaeon]